MTGLYLGEGGAGYETEGPGAEDRRPDMRAADRGPGVRKSKDPLTNKRLNHHKGAVYGYTLLSLSVIFIKAIWEQSSSKTIRIF